MLGEKIGGPGENCCAPRKKSCSAGGAREAPFLAPKSKKVSPTTGHKTKVLTQKAGSFKIRLLESRDTRITLGVFIGVSVTLSNTACKGLGLK